MPVAGSIDTAQLDLDVYGSDTVAALVVTLNGVTVAGVGVPAPVDYGDPTLVNKSWRARVPYAAAGLYWHKWTVTGAGAGARAIPVPVAPIADGTDPRHTYASTTDLANYLHDAPPIDADRKLKDATAVIDDLILCALYDVDTAGMPTDPAIKVALANAVCEQVRWRISTGDDDSAELYSSVSIAGVSLARSRSGRGSTSALARTGPGVAPILIDAGLLGNGPWTY